MSRQHAIQKLNNHHALHEIFVSVKNVCQHKGFHSEEIKVTLTNIVQLLRMKAKVDPVLAEWLKQKENNHTSSTIQNEMIKFMGVSFLCDIASSLQYTPFSL